MPETNLDRLVERFLESLAKAFRKRADTMHILAQYRDMLPSDLRRRLLGSLKTIREELGVMIYKLENG
jgi:hypothetical protein